MNSTPNQNNNLLFFLISLGSLVGMLLVWYSGSQIGPGITYDSENYIYAGEHLYKFGTLLRPQGTPFVEWAPLYPVLIAGLCFFGGDVINSIFVLQILLYGISIFFWGKTAFHYFQNKFIFTVFFLSIVFSTPLILIHHFVWSEPLFVCMSVFLFIATLKYIQNPKKKWLISMIAISCILSLQRQASIFFIPGIVLCLFFLTKAEDRKKEFFKISTYYFLSSVPLLIWWIRNKMISGSIMPNYEASFKTSFWDHYIWHHDVVSSWFLPDELPIYIRIIAIYAPLLLFYNRLRNVKTKANLFLNACIIMFTSYFLLTYLSCSVLDHPYFDEERIFSVVYIFGISGFFLFVDQLTKIVSPKLQKVIIIISFLWIIYPVGRAVHNVIFWHHIPKKTIKRADNGNLNDSYYFVNHYKIHTK